MNTAINKEEFWIPNSYAKGNNPLSLPVDFTLYRSVSYLPELSGVFTIGVKNEKILVFRHSDLVATFDSFMELDKFTIRTNQACPDECVTDEMMTSSEKDEADKWIEENADFLGIEIVK